MLLQLTDSTEEPIYLFLIAFFFLFIHLFLRTYRKLLQKHNKDQLT